VSFAGRLSLVAVSVLAPVTVAQVPPGPIADSGVAHVDGGSTAAIGPAATAPAPAAWPADPFAAGSASTEARGGAYFSTNAGPSAPRFDYVPVSVRRGWMLSGPDDYWWGRGNYECLCDLTGARATSGFGSWLAGPSLYLRFNWLEADVPVVPYVQVGAGGVLSDAYRVRTQPAIGQAFEYYLHYEVGVKCFVAPNLSVDVEGGLQHISNGGMSSRNAGVNAIGATVGLTYYFPRGD
jgi:Lipid A 3-O-deacylase (PagL)